MAREKARTESARPDFKGVVLSTISLGKPCLCLRLSRLASLALSWRPPPPQLRRSRRCWPCSGPCCARRARSATTTCGNTRSGGPPTGSAATGASPIRRRSPPPSPTGRASWRSRGGRPSSTPSTLPRSRASWSSSAENREGGLPCAFSRWVIIWASLFWLRVNGWYEKGALFFVLYCGVED